MRLEYQRFAEIGIPCNFDKWHRWQNQLDPSLNKKSWSEYEEIMFISAHKVVGNKWSEISKFIKGR